MSPTFLFSKDLELICEQLDHIAYEVEQKTHESTCTEEDEKELWLLHEQVTKASKQLKESIANEARHSSHNADKNDGPKVH